MVPAAAWLHGQVHFVVFFILKESCRHAPPQSGITLVQLGLDPATSSRIQLIVVLIVDVVRLILIEFEVLRVISAKPSQ
jgi:hypothetical protein